MNIYDAVPWIIGAIIGATAEILFKELIYNEYIAPSFRYQVNFQKNRFYKWLHNTSVELSYTSKSPDLEYLQREKSEYVTKIIQELRKRKIPTFERGDIRIENYEFGNKKYNGSIEFATNSNGKFLTEIEVTLTTQVRYNSLSNDITGITQALNKLKEYISIAIEKPLEYSDSMSCKLNRLVKELSYALIDLKIEYINLVGKNADVSIIEGKAVFNSPLYTSVIVPNLKKLVTLYA